MLEVYDKNLKRLAFLQNAYEVKRKMLFEGVGSLSFKIPKDDPKIKHCEYMNFVRYASSVGGKTKYSDYYRIAEIPSDMNDGKTATAEFYCEHGIITLIDKLMFGSYTIGNLGIYTADVLRFILSKQEVVYWQLGECDFARQFEYNWSQENLLAAVLSVPNRFDADYMFTCDMSVFPWVLNLKSYDKDVSPKYYVRKRLNRLFVKKTGDAKQIITRIYPLGYGEGVNQLTIAEVNDGVPYLQAPQYVTGKYGVVERPFIDRRFTDAQSLKDRAQVLLNGYMEPYVEYEIDASELFTRGDVVDPMPNAGDVVAVPADEMSDGIKTYITGIETVLDQPGSTRIIIANKPRDIASSIADQADRQRIEQVYAQGATNIFSYSFRDNADKGNPLIESFLIPAESVRINLVMLKFELRSFRAYNKGAAAGGALSSTSAAGGDSQQTSSSGGGQTTSSGGGSQQTSSSGGGGATTSGSSSSSTTGSYTTGKTGETLTQTWNGNTASGQMTGQTGQTGQGADLPAHTHTIPEHYHAFNYDMTHNHGMAHTHTVTFPAHSHGFEVPAHTHTVQTHTHSVNIPDHTHEEVYGIYEGGRADSVTVKVDGKEVYVNVSAGEMDIAPYLDTDGGGKIRRGAYHNVEIIPNKLTGITGSITIQLFIQSRGGGDY